MKVIVFSILLNLLLVDCYCQDDTSDNFNKISVGGNLILTGNTDWWDIGPYVSYNWIRHKIGGGIIIGKRPIRNYKSDSFTVRYYNSNNFDEDINIVGMHMMYQYLPNSPAKIFDLYFEDRFTYVIGAIEIDNSFRQSFHSFENLIGFGMKIKFLKRFAFYQSVGIGIIYKRSSSSVLKYTIPTVSMSEFGMSGGLISALEINF